MNKCTTNEKYSLVYSVQIAAPVASSEICELLIDCGADGNFVALPGQLYVNSLSLV